VLPTDPRRLSAAAMHQRSSVVRDLLDQGRCPDLISLAGGLPAPELLPTDRAAAACATVIDRYGPRSMQYGPTRGEPALLDRLDAGCITTGSQQALDLLARVLLDPGDRVITGDPEYLGLLGVLRPLGVQITAVPLTHQGIDPAATVAAINTTPAARLLYIAPRFHNPTGALLEPAAAATIGRAAAAAGTVIIEDDPYAELWFDAPPPPLEWGPAEVVRLTTTSKTLAPGLRIGALRGPDWIIDAVVVAKQFCDLHTPTLNQLVVHELLIDEPWFTQHMDRLRARYRKGRDAMVRALRHRIPDATFHEPAGGMFIWARLPGIDTGELLPTALAKGIAYAPGPAFSPTARHRDALRISFASIEPERLDVAAARLSDAVRTLQSASTRPSGR